MHGRSTLSLSSTHIEINGIEKYTTVADDDTRDVYFLVTITIPAKGQNHRYDQIISFEQVDSTYTSKGQCGQYNGHVIRKSSINHYLGAISVAYTSFIISWPASSRWRQGSMFVAV